LSIVVLAGLLVLASASCFSDLRSDQCSVDEECFANERCLAGTCLVSAVVSTNNGEGVDAGPDVEPDVVETNNGDNGKVNGWVLRASDFAPVENALVNTLPPTDQVVTDRDGRFQLDNTLFLGETFMVTVSRDKFKPATASLIFEAGGFRDLTIILCHTNEILCNDADDDCNGEVDDGLTNDCGGCGTLADPVHGACGEACPAGGKIWTCAGPDELACSAAGGEICSNGADDDCDNEADEADCIPGG